MAVVIVVVTAVVAVVVVEVVVVLGSRSSGRGRTSAPLLLRGGRAHRTHRTAAQWRVVSGERLLLLGNSEKATRNREHAGCGTEDSMQA